MPLTTGVRLWREARAAASVSHPGICQIHDVGETHDNIYIVMELLNGEPLSHRLKDGPLAIDEAITIALNILGALTALHSRDIATGILAVVQSFLDMHFDPEGLYFIARVIARVNKPDACLDMLDRIIESGFYCSSVMLRDPWLDSIRGQARFGRSSVARTRGRGRQRPSFVA